MIRNNIRETLRGKSIPLTNNISNITNSNLKREKNNTNSSNNREKERKPSKDEVKDNTCIYQCEI